MVVMMEADLSFLALRTLLWKSPIVRSRGHRSCRRNVRDVACPCPVVGSWLIKRGSLARFWTTQLAQARSFIPAAGMLSAAN
jgi:hypothetical protein